MMLNVLALFKHRDKVIDGGKLFFDSKPIFGTSVTYGGLVTSLILATIAQMLFPYHILIFWKVFSAFIGHSTASFIKRRFGVEPGKYVPFLAHGDYIVIFALISWFLGLFDMNLALTSYIFTILFTPFVTQAFHRIGLRAKPL
jgi:hypothetical protein